ncbi:MAG: hypothetical protein JRN39_05375 [Nitrososphaerota archaeon]|nr:hypothetical protein [Nitrososphaerota archaeon]
MSSNASGAERVAGGAVFGALAVVITMINLFVPFPPLPYLSFDLGEVPVLIATFLYGPVGGSISLFEYWAILQAIGPFRPVGPVLRLLATGSTVLGIWLASKLYAKLAPKGGIRGFSGLSFTVSSLFRVPVMTAANWVVLLFLFPGFLSFAYSTLGKFIGSGVSGGSGLVLVMLFTAAYNLIQLAISFALASGLSTVAVTRRQGYMTAKYWIGRFLHD